MRARGPVIGVVVAVVVGGGLALAGAQGIGPLGAALGTEVTQVAAQTVALLGESGDPNVIILKFPWPKDGYCSGQFTVPVTETGDQVRVGDVTSRLRQRGGSCAGLGTDNGMAGVDVLLAAPLGDRTVVRASDGRPLPVETPS